MEKKKESRDYSEAKRKFIVSLKKRPHNIPFAFMILTFVIYSFNLTNVSNTTATINKSFMGLSEFCIMLFSILAFVCFLNAYPQRQKPKLPMVVLLYTLEAIVALCDVVYINRINEGLKTFKLKASTMFIPKTRIIMIVHLICVIISVVLIVLIPVIKKRLAKIDTSVKLSENNDISNIELSEGE